jgi:hypothetical protein
MRMGESSMPSLLSLREDNLCQKPSSTLLWNCANTSMDPSLSWAAMDFRFWILVFCTSFLLLLSKIPWCLFKNKKGLVASLRLVRFGCNIDSNQVLPSGNENLLNFSVKFYLIF